MAIFPVFSSLRDDASTFSRLAGRAIKFLGLLGMPVTVGGVLLAKPIMVLVSGGKYASSGPLFAVLCLSIFPYFLCHVYILTLAVKNTYRLNLQFLTLFVLNVALNFILIPRMGAAGASWATVLCEFFGIGLGFYLSAPYLKGLPWARLARPALASVGASALMGVCVWTDPRLYWLVLGPLVYGLGLWALRGLDPEDWDNLHSIFRRKTA
jgi:O-antigen/teichoic acid export membrane protein